MNCAQHNLQSISNDVSYVHCDDLHVHGFDATSSLYRKEVHMYMMLMLEQMQVVPDYQNSPP